MELETLIEVLEKSVEKNGEKPLTNKWLLNMLKIVSRKVEEEETKLDNIASSANELNS